MVGSLSSWIEAIRQAFALVMVAHEALDNVVTAPFEVLVLTIIGREDYRAAFAGQDIGAFVSSFTTITDNIASRCGACGFGSSS